MAGLPPIAPMPLPQAPPSLPSMPTLRPLVTSPRVQQEQNLQSRINAFEQPGEPKTGFWHRLGHAANIARNIAEASFAPQIALMDPTSQLHKDIGHEQNVQELAGLQAQDLAEQKQASESQLQGAQTQNLENPPSQALPTSGGYVSYNPRTNQTAPLEGQGGKPLMPYVKPGPLEKVTLMGPDGKPMLGFTREGVTWDSNGQIVDKPVPFEKPGADQHITIMHDGQPHVMGKDDQGNFTRDLGIAPPNYAQMMPMVLNSKTVENTDPQTGLPVRMGFDSKTGRYDIPQGITGSGSYAHQMQSAGALERMVNSSVIPLLSQMQKKGELGPIQGRFEDWLNRDVGNANPDVAQLHQLMNGVASMLVGMYGFRRQDAADYMARQLGARMTPESMTASLTGIVQHANSIIGGGLMPSAGENPNPSENNGGNGGGSPTNTPTVIYARDPQGKLHQAPAGTPLPQGWKEEKK